MAYIYMVRCQDESLYTGIARDVGKRMREHYYQKKPGAKYTKSRQVTALEMVWQTETWSGAARLEYQIKQLRKNQKEALIREPEQVTALFGEKLQGMDYTPRRDLKLEDFVGQQMQKWVEGRNGR